MAKVKIPIFTSDFVFPVAAARKKQRVKAKAKLNGANLRRSN